MLVLARTTAQRGWHRRRDCVRRAVHASVRTYLAMRVLWQMVVSIVCVQAQWKVLT